MDPKSQIDDLRTRKSSPAAITVCDTTTTSFPATESSKYLKDAYHRHVDLITAQHVHNSHKPTDERVDLSHQPPIYDNNLDAHRTSVDYVNSDPWVSRHTLGHKSTRGYHSSPPSARKRNTDSARETIPREGSKRNKTTEQTVSGENTSTSDNCHGKEIFRDGYQHSSDDEEEMKHLRNCFDKKGGNYFTHDLSPMATRDDEMGVMGVMGSRSIVPEDVRLRINSRERQRMHDLNSALDSLRQVMPYSSGPSVKKLSKMSTLLLARNYIVMLTRSLDEMKRLVQELSIKAARPKPVAPSPLLHDSAYYASLLANHASTPTGLYLPPPLLHHSPAPHCVTSTGTLRCACVECQRKSLFSMSSLESKKASS